MFTSLLKDLIKDAVEQPDEEICRVRSERIPSARLLSLWSWGVSPFWCGRVHQPGSWKSCNWDFYGGFCMLAWSVINSISSPSPFSGEVLEGKDRAEKSVSNHGLVFLVTSSHLEAIQETTQSHPIRTKDALVVHFITWEFRRVLGALYQELGAETNVCIFYYLPMF